MFDKLRNRFRVVFRRENFKGLVIVGACIVGAIVILSVSLAVGLNDSGAGTPGDDITWANTDDNRTTGVIVPGENPLPLPGTGRATTDLFALGQTQFSNLEVGRERSTNVFIRSLDAIYYWSVGGDRGAVEVELGRMLRVRAIDTGFVRITIRANHADGRSSIVQTVNVTIGCGGVIIA